MLSPRVLIAIQARSGSTRLPKKAFALIGGKRMLDRVIDACKRAAVYNEKREDPRVRVAVLTPVDDPIVRAFAESCDIMEGPELDVLLRYRMAVERYDPDYVVRITGDCPLIPPFMISRMISLATRHSYDYVSNVDERFRTALDGIDCEVISAQLLTHTHNKATAPLDREHVTLYARRSPPDWAKMGAVIGHFDQSGLKLSVDTQDDLDRAVAEHDRVNDKHRAAIKIYGRQAVHVI